MNKETIKITGMTCAARIDRTVGKIDGVLSASVNFATEKLSVEYDEAKVSRLKINEAIIKAGYGILEEAAKNEVTIPIGGMTCAACATRVEKTIGKIDDVSKASVNFATEKATVSYDSQKVKISTIWQTTVKSHLCSCSDVFEFGVGIIQCT